MYTLGFLVCEHFFPALLGLKKKGYGCPLPFLCCHHVHGDPNVLPCASLTVSRRAFLGHPEAGLCAVGGVTGDEVAHEPGVVPTSFLE